MENEKLKEEIEKIIFNNSEPIKEWINPDGEGIETDDRSIDYEDIKKMCIQISELIKDAKHHEIITNLEEIKHKLS